MKTQSFAIQAIVEKPIIPGSDTNELSFETKSDSITEYQIAESEHTGLQVEWFPFQERFNTYGLRVGFYAEGLYSPAHMVANNYQWPYGLEGAISRFDTQYGVKMTVEVPVAKTVIAPYTSAGMGHTIYSSLIDSDETMSNIESDDNTGSNDHFSLFGDIVTKPTIFFDVFNPEVGVDVFVGRVGKAHILVNAHAQWLDFAGYEGTNQLLIGGGVGIAFNAKGKK